MIFMLRYRNKPQRSEKKNIFKKAGKLLTEGLAIMSLVTAIGCSKSGCTGLTNEPKQQPAPVKRIFSKTVKESAVVIETLSEDPLKIRAIVYTFEPLVSSEGEWNRELVKEVLEKCKGEGDCIVNTWDELDKAEVKNLFNLQRLNSTHGEVAFHYYDGKNYQYIPVPGCENNSFECDLSEVVKNQKRVSVLVSFLPPVGIKLMGSEAQYIVEGS